MKISQRPCDYLELLDENNQDRRQMLTGMEKNLTLPT